MAGTTRQRRGKGKQGTPQAAQSSNKSGKVSDRQPAAAAAPPSPATETPRRRVEDARWFTWMHRFAILLFIIGGLSIAQSLWEQNSEKEDTRPVADDRQHTLAMRVCRAGRPDLLANITSRVKLDGSWEGPGQHRLIHAALGGWHSAVETLPLVPHPGYAKMLMLLLQEEAVVMEEACPLVEAVIFRNSVAIETLLTYGNATATQNQNATAYDEWEAAMQACIKERGFYNEHVLHHSAKTKASGLARLFIKIKTAAGVSSDGVLPPTIMSALEPTLDLLKIDAKPLTEAITFPGLNAATTNWDMKRVFQLASDLGGTFTFFSSWLKAQDDHGRTPVHIAARDGMTEALFLMLDVAGKLDIHDDLYGFTAGHYAIVYGNQSVCDELKLRDPGLVIRKDKYGRAGWQLSQARGTAAGVCDTQGPALRPEGTVGDHDDPAEATDPTAAVRCGDVCQLHKDLDWHWMTSSELDAVGVDIPALFSVMNPIRTLSLDAFTADPELFRRDHESLSLPVVVRRGMTPKHPIGPHWSRQAFRSKFGDVSITAGPVPYPSTYGRADENRPAETLGAFAGGMLGVKPDVTSPPTSSPPYVFDGSMLVHPQVGPLLEEELGLPSFMTDRNLTLQQTALGPPLSGASPHFHPSAWNAVVFGRKLWFLWPRAHSEFIGSASVWEWYQAAKDDLLAKNRHQPGTPFIALQEPGDLVYIPSGWSHAVLNLADTFAVALESYE